jgi:hypothetical protein
MAWIWWHTISLPNCLIHFSLFFFSLYISTRHSPVPPNRG